MKSHTASIEITRPADDVFGYLLDLRNEPRWRHDVDTSELASGKPGADGARYRQTAKGTAYTLEVTQVDTRGRTLRFATIDASPVAVRGAYSVTGAGPESRATIEVELHPSGFVRLFEPFMGPSLRKTTTRYLTALRSELECAS
jgi:uncharacterized membrane protein